MWYRMAITPAILIERRSQRGDSVYQLLSTGYEHLFKAERAMQFAAQRSANQ